jgi:hypothetical protein
MEQQRPGFLKSLLLGITGNKNIMGAGVLTAVAIYTASNWATLEQKVEQTEKTCEQVYTQMIQDNTYTYNEYKAKCILQITELENDINSLEKQFNTNWQKNLIGEYRSTENNKISRFEGDLNKLKELADASWLSFNGNKEQNKKFATDRFRLITNLFISAKKELEYVKTIEHKKDTDVQTNEYENKNNINEYTLSEGYKVYEYLRSMLILKIERWRCLNPTDAKNTYEEFYSLKQTLDSINFNIDNR